MQAVLQPVFRPFSWNPTQGHRRARYPVVMTRPPYRYASAHCFPRAGHPPTGIPGPQESHEASDLSAQLPTTLLGIQSTHTSSPAARVLQWNRTHKPTVGRHKCAAPATQNQEPGTRVPTWPRLCPRLHHPEAGARLPSGPWRLTDRQPRGLSANTRGCRVASPDHRRPCGPYTSGPYPHRGPPLSSPDSAQSEHSGNDLSFLQQYTCWSYFFPVCSPSSDPTDVRGWVNSILTAAPEDGGPWAKPN